MDAFADPRIAAVLASIGGDDQLTVLPHLDAGLLAAHPKAFCGYSDNTNLLNYLWNLGIAGVLRRVDHGPPRRPGGRDASGLGRLAARRRCSRTATSSSFPAERFSEDEADWDQPETLALEGRVERQATGWTWHQPDRVVSGPTWGGDLEILHWNLAAGPVDPAAGGLRGMRLAAETDEELPSPE